MSSWIVFFISLVVVIAGLFAYSWFRFYYVHYRYVNSLKRGDKITYINDDLEYITVIYYGRVSNYRAEIIEGIETRVIYTYQIVDNGAEGKRIL